MNCILAFLERQTGHSSGPAEGQSFPQVLFVEDTGRDLAGLLGGSTVGVVSQREQDFGSALDALERHPYDCLVVDVAGMTRLHAWMLLRAAEAGIPVVIVENSPLLRLQSLQRMPSVRYVAPDEGELRGALSAILGIETPETPEPSKPSKPSKPPETAAAAETPGGLEGRMPTAGNAFVPETDLSKRHRLIAQLPCPAIVLSPEGALLFLNEAAQNFLAVLDRSREDLISEHLDELVTGSESAEIEFRGRDGAIYAVDVQRMRDRWYGAPCQILIFRDIHPAP